MPHERSLNRSNQAISMRWNERSHPVGERNVGNRFRRRDVGRRAIVYPEQAGTAGGHPIGANGVSARRSNPDEPTSVIPRPVGLTPGKWSF
jgi:hypothetical protein